MLLLQFCSENVTLIVLWCPALNAVKARITCQTISREGPDVVVGTLRDYMSDPPWAERYSPNCTAMYRLTNLSVSILCGRLIFEGDFLQYERT